MCHRPLTLVQIPNPIIIKLPFELSIITKPLPNPVNLLKSDCVLTTVHVY